MKILAFGAHPDDLEFGMGGTLLKLKKEGHEIALVVLSRGEAGTHGSPQIREQESRDAADFLGATIEILDYTDTEIEDNAKSRKDIANIIRKHKPDIVFAPYHSISGSHLDGRAHPDHSACGNIVRHACRFAKFRSLKMEYPEHLVKNVVYYMPPANAGQMLISDISEFQQEITRLWQCHTSQHSEQLSERLMLIRKYHGMQADIGLGEQLATDRPVMFDVGMFR